jgi:hypothetical protein
MLDLQLICFIKFILLPSNLACLKFTSIWGDSPSVVFGHTPFACLWAVVSMRYCITIYWTAVSGLAENAASLWPPSWERRRLRKCWCCSWYHGRSLCFSHLSAVCDSVWTSWTSLATCFYLSSTRMLSTCSVQFSYINLVLSSWI